MCGTESYVGAHETCGTESYVGALKICATLHGDILDLRESCFFLIWEDIMRWMVCRLSILTV
jgi:hypothetical protein